MRVLVAGATGALGPLVVRELVGRGHTVVGLTTHPDKAARLTRQGAGAVVGDLLDGPALERLVVAARPDAVVNVATRFPRRFVRTAQAGPANALRRRGTRNLLAAAVAAGARRYVSESMIFIYGYGAHDRPLAEDAPFGREPSRGLQRIIDALVASERQVRAATALGNIEGVSLRFGLFHGPWAPSSHAMLELARRRALPLIDHGQAVHSWIDVADAATAVVAALERAPSGAVYNVVGDEPVRFADYVGELVRLVDAPPPRAVPAWLVRPVFDMLAAFGTVRLPVSNRKIRDELGWRPRFTWRDALARLVAAPAETPDLTAPPPV